MPWLTIIMWLVSFLLAGGTKSGQAGKAALAATGVAAATYYLAEPANPDAMFDWFSSSDDVSGKADSGVTDSSSPGIGSAITTTAGGVLKSWGPTGTAVVIGTAAAATKSGIFSDIPVWVWVAGGLLLLTR